MTKKAQGEGSVDSGLESADRVRNYDSESDVRGISDEAASGMSAALRRAQGWRVPPNWSSTDWRDELEAVAIVAVWQAQLDYDSSRKVPVGGFIFARVLARTLTRYRQEWRYATHTTCEANGAESNGARLPDMTAFPALTGAWAIEEALCRLPREENKLLSSLYWQNRTQADIARELAISQPAVNKRKRVALEHLKAILLEQCG